MTVPAHTPTISLDLSRQDQWILQHVLLDRVERKARTAEQSDPPTLGAFRAVDTLEAGVYEFTSDERGVLARELTASVEADCAAERDRDAAAALLERVRDAVDGQPSVRDPPEQPQ